MATKFTPAEIEAQVQTARAECADARNNGAKPLAFAADAAQQATDRDQAQLRASLPLIADGWPVVRDAVLRAATLSGSVAKALAEFQNAGAAPAEITVEQMLTARGIAERACKLKLAAAKGMNPDDVDVSQGLVCGGG